MGIMNAVTDFGSNVVSSTTQFAKDRANATVEGYKTITSSNWGDYFNAFGEYAKDATNLYKSIREGVKNATDTWRYTDVDVTTMMGKPFTQPFNCDPPLYNVESSKVKYGVDYIEEYKYYPNFISLAPGFMELRMNDNKDNTKIFNLLMGNANLSEDEMSALVADAKGGDLFRFTDDIIGYKTDVGVIMEYLSSMLNISAADREEYLQFDNLLSTTGTTKSYVQEPTDYLKYLNNMRAFGSANMWVTFYHDGPIGSTESISNNTSKSQLEGLLNNNPFKAIGGEAATFLGGNKTLQMNKAGEYESVDKGFAGLFSGGKDMLTLRVSVPEIWQDSNVDRGYSLSFKFVSPYGNDLAIARYILSPLAHLLAMAAPRNYGGFSYLSPRVVKAFSLGSLNLNIGMITSMQIARVAEADNVNGLPTELKVTLNIKDLNPALSIPDSRTIIRDRRTDGSIVLKTRGLGAYLSSLTGVNYEELSVDTLVDLYKESVGTGIKRTLSLQQVTETAIGMTRNVGSFVLQGIKNF